MNEVIKTTSVHRKSHIFVKEKELPKEHLEKILYNSSRFMNYQHYS